MSESELLDDAGQTRVLQEPKKCQHDFGGPFEVPYAIIIQGIWSHNIWVI